LKLRHIIDSLLREKDELNQRLIRANHGKLAIQPAAVEESPKEAEDALEQEIHLWGCGILNSISSIDKSLP